MAYLFGALFVLQGVLFLDAGLIRRNLSCRFSRDVYAAIGGVFLFYSLRAYPTLGCLLGRRFPATPTFGLPCPTTILTFGLLLWTKRLPKYLLVIPCLWSLVGSTAAVLLGILEDLGLLVAGVLGTVLILLRNRKKS